MSLFNRNLALPWSHSLSLCGKEILQRKIVSKEICFSKTWGELIAFFN